MQGTCFKSFLPYLPISHLLGGKYISVFTRALKLQIHLSLDTNEDISWDKRQSWGKSVLEDSPILREHFLNDFFRLCPFPTCWEANITQILLPVWKQKLHMRLETIEDISYDNSHSWGKSVLEDSPIFREHFLNDLFRLCPFPSCWEANITLFFLPAWKQKLHMRLETIEDISCDKRQSGDTTVLEDSPTYREHVFIDLFPICPLPTCWEANITLFFIQAWKQKLHMWLGTIEDISCDKRQSVDTTVLEDSPTYREHFFEWFLPSLPFSHLLGSKYNTNFTTGLKAEATHETWNDWRYLLW